MARQSDQGTGRVNFHDEFDTPAAGPIGLHRGKRSLGARLMPYIIVFIIAALCALLAWGFLSGNIQALFGGSARPVVTASQMREAVRHRTDNKSDSKADSSSKSSSSDSTSTQSSKTTSDDYTTAKSDSAKSDTKSSEKKDSTAQSVNHVQQVTIFNALPANAADRDGFAGRQASILTNAGYTNVQASVMSVGMPQQNTVWYRDSADEATARDVAAKFGITSVAQKADLREPIAAVFVAAQQ